MPNNCCRRILLYFFVFLITSIFNQCAPKLPTLPRSAACTFTLSGIFANCHNPTNSTGPISYTVDLKVQWYSGSIAQTLDEKTATSSSPPSSTMTIVSKVPNDGTPWQVVVLVTGTQCARCALTQSAQGPCTQEPITSPYAGYTAAKPVFQAYYSRSGYYSAFGVGDWVQLSNVNNSCNCTVPNN